MDPSHIRDAAVVGDDPSSPAFPAYVSADTGADVTHQLAQQILLGMQRDIEAQIDWKLQHRTPGGGRVGTLEVGLILGSIGIGVPLTAIAGAVAGLPGLAIVWVAIVLINVAWAARR